METTIAQARAAGEKDGQEAVLDVYSEQGAEALRACQAPGHDDWDEAAIGAGAAELSLHDHRLSDEAREEYYAEYNSAASKLADELLRKSPACQ